MGLGLEDGFGRLNRIFREIWTDYVVDSKDWMMIVSLEDEIYQE
jgi:hypothetical protein